MWPREVFHCFDKAHRREVLGALDEPGVYILYRDDIPYYVGKADNKLTVRLWQHANLPSHRHYNFWNFFSAFVIKDPTHRNAIEGILIAGMPTANSARPKLPRERIPYELKEMLQKMRQGQARQYYKQKVL